LSHYKGAEIYKLDIKNQFNETWLRKGKGKKDVNFWNLCSAIQI